MLLDNFAFKLRVSIHRHPVIFVNFSLIYKKLFVFLSIDVFCVFVNHNIKKRRGLNMKNQALIFALGTVVFGHVYSSEPLAEQALGEVPQENGTFASELQQYRVTHCPTYVKTALKQRNVTKKSLVEVNSRNTLDITRAFIDLLGESLEDTNTAVGDRLDSAIEQFKAILKEQKVIAVETAKDLINIFKQKAEEMFPSSEFALSLDEKIRNLKFAISLGGKLEPVQREPREVCCGILSCILSTSYDYLQRQQKTTNRTLYHYSPSRGGV